MKGIKFFSFSCLFISTFHTGFFNRIMCKEMKLKIKCKISISCKVQQKKTRIIIITNKITKKKLNDQKNKISILSQILKISQKVFKIRKIIYITILFIKKL